MSEVKAAAACAASSGGAEPVLPIRPAVTLESIAATVEEALREAREARREATAARRLIAAHLDDAKFERTRGQLRHDALLEMLKEIIGRLP